MLTQQEFDVMYYIYRSHADTLEQIMSGLKKSRYQVCQWVQQLQDRQLLSGFRMTEAGRKALDEYKVDNAIMMAAGFSSRSMPLSGVLPKGLFEVRGQVLIERQIEQLRAAGITEIVIVTGYKAERFAYLAEKYPGVVLVHNPEYSTRNNLSSIYAARKYIRSSYICCSDNYFGRNVFESHVYDSYYGCKYSDEFVNEDCVVEVEDGYIRKIVSGESHCWYTIAEAYFNRKFSETYLRRLEEEYQEEDVVPMRMDDFHIKHIRELDLRVKEYTDEDVMEFDRLDEFMEFDPDFIKFCNRMLNQADAAPAGGQLSPDAPLTRWFGDVDVSCKYKSVPTEQLEGRLHLNENLFGPSPKCREVLKQVEPRELSFYNMARENPLVRAISGYEQVGEGNIFVHNGSAEVIRVVFGMMLRKGDVVLLPDPGWGYYESMARVKRASAVKYSLTEEADRYSFDIQEIQRKIVECKPKLVVIISPNNPTGNVMSQRELETLLDRNPGTMFFVDQAYSGFSTEAGLAVGDILARHENIIVSKTFSKFWGLANIRMGYGMCAESIRSVLEMDLPPFGFANLPQKVAAAAMSDPGYYADMKRRLVEVRDWFRGELNRLTGVKALASEANFVYVRFESGADFAAVRRRIEARGIKVRCFRFHDRDSMRITIGPRPLMEQVLDCFRGESSDKTE